MASEEKTRTIALIELATAVVTFIAVYRQMQRLEESVPYPSGTKLWWYAMTIANKIAYRAGAFAIYAEHQYHRTLA